MWSGRRCSTWPTRAGLGQDRPASWCWQPGWPNACPDPCPGDRGRHRPPPPSSSRGGALVPGLGTVCAGITGHRGFLAFASLPRRTSALNLRRHLGSAGSSSSPAGSSTRRCPTWRAPNAAGGRVAGERPRSGCSITASVPTAWGLCLGATDPHSRMGTASSTERDLRGRLQPACRGPRGGCAAGQRASFLDLRFRSGPIVFAS